MSGGQRRKFTAEQKAKTVALVRTREKSIYQISGDLDLSEVAFFAGDSSSLSR